MMAGEKKRNVGITGAPNSAANEVFDALVRFGIEPKEPSNSNIVLPIVDVDSGIEWDKTWPYIGKRRNQAEDKS